MAKLKIYIFLFSFLYFGMGGFILGLIPNTELLYRYLIVFLQGLLVISAFFSVSKLKNSFNVKLLIVFFIVSTLSFFYNAYKVGLATHLNGLRDALTFLSALIVAESIFRSKYKEYFKKLFIKSLIIFAILQIPVTFNQFLRYGAGDFVSGSLSYGDLGGGSGILTQSLFLISFFLLVNYGYKTEPSFSYKKLIIFLVLLLPVTINETKISFILFPLYLLLIFGNRRRFSNLLLGSIVIYGILITYFNFYSKFTPQQVRLFHNFNYLRDYYASVNLQSNNITRFGKIILFFDKYSHHYLDIILGLGYGLTKGQHILGQSKIGYSLQFLYHGTRVLFFETILTGGLLLTFAIGYANFFQILSIKKDRLKRSIWLFKWFLILVSIMSWFYNPFIFNPFLGILVAYFITWIQFSSNSIIQNKRLKVY